MYEIIKELSLPPGNLLLLFTLGVVLLLAGARRLGTVLIIVGLAALYLLSTPYVANRLSAAVEPPAPLAQSFAADQADAIVVLAAGAHRFAPEYAQNGIIDEITLQRLAYAAFLWRRTQLPILVSGGPTMDGGTSLAVLMKDALDKVFGVPVQWVEDRSINTYDNAQLSAEILRRENKPRVLLVAHALHMPRAAQLFKLAGLTVIPAPTIFPASGDRMKFLPKQSAAQTSYYAIYELLGTTWYRLRGRLPAKP